MFDTIGMSRPELFLVKTFSTVVNIFLTCQYFLNMSILNFSILLEETNQEWLSLSRVLVKTECMKIRKKFLCQDFLSSIQDFLNMTILLKDNDQEWMRQKTHAKHKIFPCQDFLTKTNIWNWSSWSRYWSWPGSLSQ